MLTSTYPFVSRLVVPCLDVFERGLYSVIEGFKVAVPEVLLFAFC